VKENDVLTRPTLEKLNEMRLFGMAKAWEAQRDDPGAAGLAFDERLALLVDAEHLARQNRRTTTRLREAKLRNTRACMEDLDTGPKRGLERALARQLATCHWVEQKQNILVTGPTCCRSPRSAGNRSWRRRAHFPEPRDVAGEMMLRSLMGRGGARAGSGVGGEVGGLCCRSSRT
jgi:hypothetical protein